MSDLGLFDGVLARGGVREAVSDIAWLQAMLDVEAALARAEAGAGVISSEHAEAIAGACRAERFDIATLGQQAAAVGNPAAPLVSALREQVGGSAAADVHRGATSQDIVDSAAMLVARRALEALLAELDAAANAAASLAVGHRDTIMAGRTLLQHAVPVTFGLKAAGWLVALDESAARLRAVRDTRLAAQLGGAAGTLAALGEAGPDVLGRFARELGLAEPVVPWHTDRTRIAELASALGATCGVGAKVAGDLVLLAQTDVGEVSEGEDSRGGSSTMPHKRNPVAAISARAAARQAPGLVATLLAAMEHEHERAAGAWHAEWAALRALLSFTGSAAAWLRDGLEHLEVDPQRMRENLERTGGAPLAERVARALAGELDRDGADELVREALAGGRLEQAASEHLGAEEAERLLDPAGYLGATEMFIDRALSAHEEATAHAASGAGRWVVTPVAVHHDELGRQGAQVVVLSNSLGSTPAMWDGQVRALAQHLRVVRYDHRGHGDSPVPPAPYELADLGGDVLALLDRLGLERVHWCGLSLGGMVGMWLAINAPERIDRLVLCCTSARLGPPEMWAQRAATVRADGVEAIADAGIERWLSPAFAERNPAVAAEVRAMLVATPAEGYAACCGAIERMDLVPDLGAISAPTLVIAAANDPATPPEHGERIAANVPGARLAIVDDARHMATIERPQAMTDLIAGHLLA